MRSALIHRRLPSPMHAARAGIVAIWVAALSAASLLLYHPLALAAIALATLLASSGAGVGRQVRRALRFAFLVALPIVVVNVLVSRNGLTVFMRLGSFGPFGQLDLTVEALVYGAVIALKVTDLILLSVLASLTVDPDELIVLCRRLSFRSALTASVAMRTVPLLAADAQRLAEAQRTRPEARPGTVRARALLVGASVGGALDRAMDLAATLELRGLASPARATAGARDTKPLPRVAAWAGSLSRHDIAFACSALAVLALAIAARLADIAPFVAYPLLRCSLSVSCAALCVALVAAAIAPFADRRGISR